MGKHRLCNQPFINFMILVQVEETGDLGKSEIATEREVQRELSLEKTLSQSCEDLSLSENKVLFPGIEGVLDGK